MGTRGARSSAGRQRSQDSRGGTGGARQGARSTTHIRCPETPLGSVRGRRPEGHCHGRYCTYTTNARGHRSDEADRDQVKRDMQLCMWRGHEGRGKQIGAFLAGAGRKMMHPAHHTQTDTYNGTTTTTPGTSQRSNVDSVAGPTANTTTARRLTQLYTKDTATETRPLTDDTHTNYQH